MGDQGAFSWNSELPSGRSPFWIRDAGLAGLGLEPGDAVGVDTSAQPLDGDVVVFEAELPDGDSVRLARRFRLLSGGRVRLEAVGADLPALELAEEHVLLMGVVRSRLRIQDGGQRVVEAPLATPAQA